MSKPTDQIFITKGVLEKALEDAFEQGEDYGTEYGGWYTVTEEQRRNRKKLEVQKIIKSIS